MSKQPTPEWLREHVRMCLYSRLNMVGSDYVCDLTSKDALHCKPCSLLKKGHCLKRVPFPEYKDS